MLRTPIVIALLLAAAVAPHAAGAATVVSTADYQLTEAASRFYDSRTDPNYAVGVEKALTFGVERMIANVSLFDVTEPSWVYMHPCGQAPDRSEPAAAYNEPGMNLVNLVPIQNTAPCFTVFGGAEIVVDLVATQGNSTPGVRYVALDVPIEVSVSPVGGVTSMNLRVGGVPSNAEAVAIGASIDAPDSGTVVWTLESCAGLSRQQGLVAANGESSTNLFIVPIDVTGSACFRSITATAPADAFVIVTGYFAPAVAATPVSLPYRGFVEREFPGFVAQAPERLFDTRDSGVQLAAGDTYRYQFTGLPAEASAVALTITATDTTGPGYVSAYPCDTGQRPIVSNVNFNGANLTVPNFAIVSLGATQEICFYALTTTHLFADLSGHFADGAGDGLVPANPTRVFDTRDTGQPVPGGTVYPVDLTGKIAADATAVVMNVTATETTGPGYLTVYPCDQTPPTASNVNFLANETRPDVVTVKVPTDRRVCIYTPTTTHVFADLAGWYAPTSEVGLVVGQPFRFLDTRGPAGSQPLASGETWPVDVGESYIEAVAWNLTVTETEGPGYVTGYPCSGTLPAASNVNYTAAGQTVANFAFLTPDAAGDVCFYALTGTHLVADEAGFFAGPLPTAVDYEVAAGFAAAAAARPADSAIWSRTSSVWARPTKIAS